MVCALSEGSCRQLLPAEGSQKGTLRFPFGAEGAPTHLHTLRSVKLQRAELHCPQSQPMQAVIEDIPYKVYGGRTELVKRLLAEKCELCGSTENIEVHHIRKLADLKKKGQAEVPKWVQIMSARKRKTLVVCRECHVAIHNGNITKSS